MFTRDQHYRLILENLEDGVAVMDADRRIRFWNRAAERITGIKAFAMLGSFCGDHLLAHFDADGLQLCGHDCPMEKALQEGERCDRDIFVGRPDGEKVPVRMRVSPLLDETGLIQGVIEQFTDNSGVASALELASALQDSAYEDPLTGLGNRRFSEYRIAQAVDRRVTRQEPLVVGFVDIDHFKYSNDRYGHARGDEILQQVAGILRRSLRTSDYVGRWGGEEFIFLLPGCGLDEGVAVAERSRTMVQDSSAGVTISLGLTLHRSTENWEEAVRRADALMYRSKRNGRNQVTPG